MVTQEYRERFAAMLAAAKLDFIDPRVTPEEFPDEKFDDLNNGLRIVHPDYHWFKREQGWMSARSIEQWFASKEALSWRRPATLAHAFYVCANSDLEFRFFDWHTVLVFASRSVTGGLMPTFRRRSIGRCLELAVSYNRNEGIDSAHAILVCAKH